MNKTTPGTLTTALLVAGFLCYKALWSPLAELIVNYYDQLYKSVFQDMGLYYVLLIASIIVSVLISGICFITASVKLVGILSRIMHPRNQDRDQ